MPQDTILGTDSVKDALKTKVNDDFSEVFASIAALASGSGVVVSSNDTSVGYLNGKLVAGEAIDLTEVDDGGDESLTVSCEDASETNKGVLETATDAEAVAKTATDKALVPSNIPDIMASPGPIGGTTPSTGAFTSVDINGGTIDGAAINGSSVGGTTPAAGTFTVLEATTDPTGDNGVGNRGYNDLRYTALDDALGDALMFGGM